MVVEILGGILWARAGSARRGATRLSNGTFIAVIDISAFVDPSEFRTEIEALLAYLKSTPKSPRVEAILYPGEPKAMEQQRRESHGVPLDDETWQQITTLAQELGISVAVK